MGTTIPPFLRVLALFLIGSFFVFNLAHAQEEEGLAPPPEIEEVFLESQVDEDTASGSPGSSVDLVERSMRLAELAEAQEEAAKAPSVDTISVEGIKKISVQLGVFGFLLLLLLVQIAFLVRDGSNYAKKFVFTLMVLVVALPSVYFIVSTIYVNLISETRGPVHWHADFEIYACGELLPPAAPVGKLSNKTGTPVLHQHEDERVHVEGVLVKKEDASLQNFFRVQGGELTHSSFRVPTGDGLRTFTNGDVCPDGNRGIWNVFLYQVDEETREVTRERMDEYTDYVLSPYINVPDGDCIIFEFGPEKEMTEYICPFYQIAINEGEIIPTWTQ